MKRILKHWLYPQWRIRKAFSKTALNSIEAAVATSEMQHDGELRFVVEGRLGLSHLLRYFTARQRAEELFSQLRVWDTEHNSGVLIYVQLVDRKVELLADRGIHKMVGNETWQRICADMEQAFRSGKFEEGAVRGVQAAGGVLAQYFPVQGANPNEMSDAPLVL
jgi:uncharacterized membrane protein